ncbi:MAG: ribonuclease P protein component [bacterium]|nr:ribonuclease P protein component [bacterium]
MALPKQSRIKKKKDFEKILKTGSSLRNSFFLIKFIRNSLLTDRAAIVVPVSIASKAVERNKLKRTISAALRNIVTAVSNSKTSHTDFIIMAQTGVKNKKYREVSSSLRDILQKANIV